MSSILLATYPSRMLFRVIKASLDANLSLRDTLRAIYSFESSRANFDTRAFTAADLRVNTVRDCANLFHLVLYRAQANCWHACLTPCAILDRHGPISHERTEKYI